MARLLSVNVGLPRDISWEGKTVHTAIWKSPVQGRRMVRRLNIDGDGQGDLVGHGGEHRAVFVYQMGSYRYWEDQLQRKDFSFGQFGENFTVDGLSDDEVCIGDRYRIGNALFEVTQPRVTCYRVGIRMNEPRMAALLVEHHRPGFYFRVLEEGEVGIGDEIVKVADAPVHLTVAQTDALLYLPGQSREQLQKAIDIPALSEGWKGSFRAMLLEEEQGRNKGTAGLGPSSEPPPAWPGFRRLRVERTALESNSVMSLVLEPDDGRPLSSALPGQFVVLRLHPNPNVLPVLRNYSLSDTPSADHYRVSVKQEVNGVASTFLHTRVRQNDVLEVSAPRGSFTLLSDTAPVVLLSAGVGATPVLAMLHALVAESSPREVWWVYGAKDGSEHPFHQEVRALIQSLPRARTCVRYSHPRPEDQVGVDFDRAGHVSSAALQEIGVPREANFYLCGPTPFLRDLTAGLSAWGVSGTSIHTEIFGPGESITPGVAVHAVASSPHPPHGPAGDGPRVSFARSGLTVPWNSKFGSLLEFAEACDVTVRWSCRTGVCHTCESGLISGTVSYQPEPLQAPADGNLLICCSKPKEEIVLDL